MLARHRESSRLSPLQAALVAALFFACSQAKDNTFTPATGSGAGGSSAGSSGAGGDTGTTTGGLAGTLNINPNLTGAGGSGMPSGPCKNLSCQQTTCSDGACKEMACPAGQSTQVTGTVLDPAGKIPLYNVIVYVPNAPLDPITDGVTCDKCGNISGSPIATTLTDVKGQFVLNNVPVGSDIPLVVQIGKWRRELKVPTVPRCAVTPIADTNLTRLPRNQMEGHIPKMALTTGGLDPLECLLRKIGIEDSEFTPEAGQGRVNYYAGYKGTAAYAPTLNGGMPFSNVQPFWNTVDSLKRYDLVLMACDGEENPQDKSQAARDAVKAYSELGGRLFMSHWNNFWLEHGAAPLPTVATWNHQPDLANPFTALLDTTFPKGMAFADWLLNVKGSMVRGQLVIREAQHTIDAVNANLAQRWIYGDTPQSVQYLTLNTPVTAKPEDQCGRIVLSDIHVSSGDTVNTPFPNGCMTKDLSPQELALEFMLFDLASCVKPDDQPPEPPIIN
jgi:hypothetical protein